MADPAPTAAPEIMMEPRLTALNLFLKHLDIPPRITTMLARKTLQKAVYLGQLSGVDLGYRFGWYLRGPYSTDLAKTYYRLAEALGSGERASGELKPAFRQKLETVRPLLTPPEDVDLVPPDWLELLASWHYLRAVRRLDHDQAKQTIKTEKAGLLAYVDVADKALRDAALLV